MCNAVNCKLCGRLICSSDFVKSKVNGRPFPIATNYGQLTCKSEKVIYVIECIKCRKQYVGQTVPPLKVRINHHIVLRN